MQVSCPTSETKARRHESLAPCELDSRATARVACSTRTMWPCSSGASHQMMSDQMSSSSGEQKRYVDHHCAYAWM